MNALLSFWRQKTSEVEIGSVYESTFSTYVLAEPLYIILIVGIDKSIFSFNNLYYIKQIGGFSYFGKGDTTIIPHYVLKKHYKRKYSADEYTIASIIE